MDSIAILRPVRDEDKALILKWRNSPDVAPYMYTDHQISEPEHNQWFDGIKSDLLREYWVIESASVPVGLASLYAIDRKNLKCAWAFYLADPSTRGKGIGTFVEFAVIERAFNELGLNKLWCEVLEINETVWKLHQSFGFEIEARYRQHVFKNGVPMNVVGLALFKTTWAHKREEMRSRLEKISSRFKRTSP